MKTPKLFFLLLLIGTLPFYSCGKSTNKIAVDNPEPMITTSAADQMGTNNIPRQEFTMLQVSDVPNIVDRMIIKTGTMNLETEKYDDALNQINDYVKKAGGFVTNSSTSVNPSGKKQGTLTIRINSDKYDVMLNDMKNFGKVLNSQVNGNDVTSEYIDLQARMNTQTELEKRLLSLLNEKTAKLIDVVEVEQKLSNVREVIEKTQGRMKYLKNQTDFSTLTVSIYEPSLLNTSSGGGFFYEISNGFSKGLEGFTEVLAGMITFIIALTPILILLLAFIYLAVHFYKKSRARKIKTA